MAIRQIPRRQYIDISSEAAAWRLLEELNSPDFATPDALPRIKKWPDFQFKFWIEGRSLLLTAPVMEAMVEYQKSLNRAFLIALEGSGNLRGLSEEERREFELIFTVKRGSTDLGAKVQELATLFVEKVAGKMTGRQATVLILAFILAYAGHSSWCAYLEQQKEIALAEASGAEAKELLSTQRFATETDLKRWQLLTSTVDKVLADRAILQSSDEGKKAVLKAASKVQDTEIAGRRIDPDIARRLTRAARSAPEIREATASYHVMRVDSDVADGFRVRLEDVESGEQFFADVRDVMVSERDRDLIKRGEWEKKPIVARLEQTVRRGGVSSARIIRVLRVEGDADLAQN